MIQFGLVIETLIKEGVRFVRSSLGANQVRVGVLAQPSGEDSVPLSTDKMILVPTERAGIYAAVAAVDTGNDPLALPGEKRLYARNASGEVVAYLWLRNDGRMGLVNEHGVDISVMGDSLSLTAPGGVVCQNDLTVNGGLDIQGNLEANNIQSRGSIKGPDGIELVGHRHTCTAPGSPSSPPTP